MSLVKNSILDICTSRSGGICSDDQVLKRNFVRARYNYDFDMNKSMNPDDFKLSFTIPPETRTKIVANEWEPGINVHVKV